MHRIPRDISGSELSRRLEANYPGGTHRITIPSHDSIKIGTLNNIIADIAEKLGTPKSELADRLFGK